MVVSARLVWEIVLCPLGQEREAVPTLTTSGLRSSSELILGMATASFNRSINLSCRPSTSLKNGSRCGILSKGLYKYGQILCSRGVCVCVSRGTLCGDVEVKGLREAREMWLLGVVSGALIRGVAVVINRAGAKDGTSRRSARRSKVGCKRRGISAAVVGGSRPARQTSTAKRAQPWPKLPPGRPMAGSIIYCERGEVIAPHHVHHHVVLHCSVNNNAIFTERHGAGELRNKLYSR
jgi:hypothetical protein